MTKLERTIKLIGYLIFTEKLSLKAIQQEIAVKIGYNRIGVSKALNGDEKYLTDNFLEKFNYKFGVPFNVEWLLFGKGEPLSAKEKNIFCGDVLKSVVVNGDVAGTIDNSSQPVIDKDQISDLKSCIEYIKKVSSGAFWLDKEKDKRIKEKDDIIKRKDDILDMKDIQIKELYYRLKSEQERVKELTDKLLK
jgi:hypothetical protein